MAWRLAKSLGVLRDEINTIAPGRSKASDGTIGDQRHRASSSDHNPNSAEVVCAGDFTHDPAKGADMHRISEHLRTHRHPSLKYVIWNRRICSAASGWKWRAYTGSNPHTKHMHVSVGVGPDGRSTGPYDDTSPWGLLKEDDMSEKAERQIETLHAIITGWRSGMPKTPDGRGIEPVSWRIRDEAWQKRVDGILVAVAAAVEGLDMDAVLRRLDEHAQAAAARDAELVELVRAGQSGELTAEQVLTKLRDLLPAGSEQQG